MPGLATNSLSTRTLHNLNGVSGGVGGEDRLAKLTRYDVVSERCAIVREF